MNRVSLFVRTLAQQATAIAAVLFVWFMAALPVFAQGPAVPVIDAALLAKANAGYPAAQVSTGEQYAKAAAAESDREQAEADAQQALAWYRKAADQGDVRGEIHLAALFRDGAKGISRDMGQAAAWYRKAAEQGDAGAQGALGMLYTLGQGVARDDIEAYFWLDLAASAGGASQAQYIANRQNVGTRITADELAQVQERLTRWKRAHPRPAGVTR
jgi:TPR repeat protein